MECSGTPLTCTACEDGYNIIADRDDGEPRCGRETGSNLSAGAIAGIYYDSRSHEISPLVTARMPF